ncbi:MAG: acyl-CoA dehydrogenase family protein [Candidatus Binatia bacterium]|nr:acyl-CoA dehydrogenase family protein [Candidatus Binatia bacterium]
MDFGLSSDQVLFQSTLRRFLAEQCPTTRVRAIMETETAHDPELWSGLCNLGVAGLMVPPEHGGAGLELLDLALAAEELGYACTPGPFLAHALATICVLEGASAAQQKAWLPAMAEGTSLGSVAWGEAGSQWDPQQWRTTFDGHSLTGQKLFVPCANVAQALFVGARTPGGGVGLFRVERDAPGITVTNLTVVDMTRKVQHVRFDRTPAVPLEGPPTGLQRAIDAGCILIAADAFGGSKRCLEMAVNYAKTREQFGQVIGAFQAVKHQLANMACELEPALSLWWYAAHAYDHIRDQAERHAAMVKAHLSDLYDRITRDATELHGGIGFTWEFDLHLWFRRAIFDRGFLGDAHYHRERAARLAGW